MRMQKLITCVLRKMVYAFLRQNEVEKKTMTSVQIRATQPQALEGRFRLSRKVPFRVYSYTVYKPEKTLVNQGDSP
jgi:hypothetical protein